MARKSNDKWTAEDDARLSKLYNSGKPPLLIAASLSRSKSSIIGRLYVLRKLAAAGGKVALPTSKKHDWSPADERQLVDMKKAGASVTEIATVMKRTEAAIENRIHVLKYRGSST
jgi:hypothetical protein